jgi:hypothetical protein
LQVGVSPKRRLDIHTTDGTRWQPLPSRGTNEKAQGDFEFPLGFWLRFVHWCNEQAFWSMKKERERFYLLPGMGGRALRRKQKIILRWSILAGLLVSAVVAGLLYLLYVSGRR